MSLIQEKVKQASGLLKEFNVDCWITFTRESAINGDPVLVFLSPSDLTWHSAFILDRKGGARAIVGQFDRKSVEDSGAYDQVTGYVTGIREPLQEYLKALDPAKIAVNFSEGSEICDGLTHGMYLTLHRLLSEIGMADRLVSSEKIVSALRERKAGSELAAMRKAALVTEEIYGLVGGFIRPGLTEKEIAAFIQAEIEKRGLVPAWAAETCPAVFTGPDTAGAHYSPTDRRVEPGHIVNMDFGVKVDRYCSDMQRTFYVAAPGETEAPEDVRHGFETIVRAIEACRAAMVPGALGVAIDTISRKIITEAGYEEFPHALGHQVGRYAHDGTALLGPRWEKYAGKPFLPLEDGMVFTIEPRLTVAGHGVVTIEEMVIVRKGGAEWLVPPQKELKVIEG
jgi:Xaa-Pro aminopeptidase